MFGSRNFAGFAVFTLLACHAVAAGDIVLESGEKRAALLELYTSEGCSSCPPADRFLSSLLKHPSLWNGLVPVAFHVDYWDYIGWRDRFADPAFSARQRDYANADAVRTVYTPGFIFDGAEWRGGRFEEFTEDVDVAGKLTAVIGEDTVSVGFDAAGNLQDPIVNVALLGFGFNSDVSAGENDGRVLNHDFVVLQFDTVPLDSVRGTLAATAALPTSEYAAERHAIAVWVSANGLPHPVQAVGGWLN